MLDKNVGDALLKLDLTPRAEAPSSQVDRIIDADRKRVKLWTRIAIGLWILAAVGAIGIFIMGAITLPAIAQLVMEEDKAKVAETKVPKGTATTDMAKNAKNEKKGPLDNPDTPLTMLAKLTAMCMVFGTASFMLLVFAGLATVLLLTRSRTATFRQINANLLQISEQLKRVPPAPSGTAGS